MSVHNAAPQHILLDFISYVLPRLNSFIQTGHILNNLHEHVNIGSYAVFLLLDLVHATCTRLNS